MPFPKFWEGCHNFHSHTSGGDRGGSIPMYLSNSSVIFLWTKASLPTVVTILSWIVNTGTC